MGLGLSLSFQYYFLSYYIYALNNLEIITLDFDFVNQVYKVKEG